MKKIVENKIIEETIDFLKNNTPNLENITVERMTLGLFYTGCKLSTGDCGLSFTPIKEIPDSVCCPSSMNAMPYSGKLTGKKASDYFEMALSDSPLKSACGLSVINALSTPFIQNEKYEIADSFDLLDLSKYDKTVVIGALVPMLKKLNSAHKEYTVLEQDARTLKGDELKHFRPSEDYVSEVPTADLLVITGVTILNNSLIEILKYKKENATVLITGPTASLVPQILFDFGVTDIGGVLVAKPDECLDLLAEGGSGYHLFGKSIERINIKC